MKKTEKMLLSAKTAKRLAHVQKEICNDTEFAIREMEAGGYSQDEIDDFVISEMESYELLFGGN